VRAEARAGPNENSIHLHAGCRHTDDLTDLLTILLLRMLKNRRETGMCMCVGLFSLICFC
jgi:hypothetical protein